jgi:hypothetical protein
MATTAAAPVLAAAALKVLPEPELEFRYEQQMHDPHAGLALFGPYSADTTSHPKSVIYGVLGSPQGTDAFHTWPRLMRQAIAEPLEPKRKMGRLLPVDDRKHISYGRRFPASRPRLPLNGPRDMPGNANWIAITY